MSTTVADETVDDVAAPRPARLTVVLISVIAVAVAAVAVAAGFWWGSNSTSSPSMPKANSVDAGFARDMATHHQQAVTMAAYARDNSTDPAVVTLAYDIESSQTQQLGEMVGWLDTWGLSRNDSSPMAWIPGHHHVSANGLMPGMATAAQMDELLASHGKALDILFLQLMIRHHQGGKIMAQYAQQHAKEPYVRSLAQAILGDQLPQITQMEQMLRQLGGQPLPPPAD